MSHIAFSSSGSFSKLRSIQKKVLSYEIHLNALTQQYFDPSKLMGHIAYSSSGSSCKLRSIQEKVLSYEIRLHAIPVTTFISLTADETDSSLASWQCLYVTCVTKQGVELLDTLTLNTGHCF